MKKILLFGLMASMLLITSCTKEDVNSKGKTAMTISLVSEGSVTRATTPVTNDQENTVNSMTVMVFGSGVLEKKVDLSGITGKITDLNAGAKKVVVIANPSNNLKTQLASVTNYADLNDPDKVNLELSSQLLSSTDGSMNTSDGLVMTGERDVMLYSGVENSVAISIKRVVAKVKVGTITIAPDDPAIDVTKFTLKKVYIEKVRSKSQLGFPQVLLPEVSPSKFNYLGGVLGAVSTTVDTRLSGDVVAGANDDYFYVMPNNNNTGNCTLMTIMGTYDGVDQYYVFRINDKVVPGEPTTGKYIERNHVYTVNITLKRLADGNHNGDPTDPETPSDTATLDVTVTPEDWVVVPVQNVTW